MVSPECVNVTFVVSMYGIAARHIQTRVPLDLPEEYLALRTVAGESAPTPEKRWRSP